MHVYLRFLGRRQPKLVRGLLEAIPERAIADRVSIHGEVRLKDAPVGPEGLDAEAL